MLWSSACEQRCRVSPDVKSVSSRADRADDIRLTIASNGVTQAPDVDVDGARVHDGVRAPDLIDDLLARKGAVRVLHQELKEPIFRRAEVDVPTIARHPKGRQINHYLSELQASAFGMSPSPPQESPDSGEQLGDAERLDHVIVRTGIKTANGILSPGATDHNHTHIFGFRLTA